MRKVRNVAIILVGALVAVALPAMAGPVTGQAGWPEPHTGAYLGVQISTVTPERAAALKLKDETGAVITYVDQDGPACRAGLLENDVVVGYDGSKVESPEQLQALIHATPPAKLVTLTVLRNSQRKDIKVKLGSRTVMANARSMAAVAMGPPPPRAIMPDIEIPAFTVLSSRHGLVVESLSPQLADFFGATRGHGVLVRSVEAGSPAAAAGLKAGDVIMKVNNEIVHDLADWQRGLHTRATKFSIEILRDKREQTVVISVPAPDNSKLQEQGWDNLEPDVQAFGKQMEQLRPELGRNQAEMMAELKPSDKELEQMRREIEKSMKRQQKEMRKMSREMAKSGKPAQKDLDEMKRQIAASMPSQKDFDEMRRQISDSMPSQKEFDDMRQQIKDSMKNWTPQLQQQMEELRKEMEQRSLDLQQMMQGPSSRDF